MPVFPPLCETVIKLFVSHQDSRPQFSFHWYYLYKLVKKKGEKKSPHRASLQWGDGLGCLWLAVFGVQVALKGELSESPL